MNKLVMFVGLPGTGKSTFVDNFTWSRVIIDTNVYVHVASLDYLVEENRQDKETYTEAWARIQKEGGMKRLEQQMIENVKFFVSTHDTDHTLAYGSGIVLWDQTNLTVKSRAAKLKMFDKTKWTKYAFVFKLPTEELCQRLGAREQLTGKHIPPHVLTSMSASYEPPTCDEGFNFVFPV